MKRLSTILKPLIPILAAAYGLMLIYLTALPLADRNPSLGAEALTWLLTVIAIAITYFLIQRIQPKLFPEAKQFSMKWPAFSIVAGLILIAPLWNLVEAYAVYGLTSLIATVHTEPISSTPDELREDLIAGVHAVLLAPLLEELCFRQLAISPFRRRRNQIIVCILMALLFGILHVRNFPGAFLSAILYGFLFIQTRNIWYPVILHAGHNLAATLLALYCFFDIGQIQMSKSPVIILPDTIVTIASVTLALIGFVILKRKQS